MTTVEISVLITQERTRNGSKSSNTGKQGNTKVSKRRTEGENKTKPKPLGKQNSYQSGSQPFPVNTSFKCEGTEPPSGKGTEWMKGFEKPKPNEKIQPSAPARDSLEILGRAQLQKG